MNLVLFGYVAWKHRRLLLVGVVLATLLALFSVFRVGSGGLSFRQQEQWVTHETLLVTQPGFPVGRTTLNIAGAPTAGVKLTSPQFVDPARLTDLAALYAQLATSDVIRQRMLIRGRIEGAQQLEAQPVSDANGNALPLIDIAASADSASASERLVERASWALRSYIEEGQKASKVGEHDRVVLEVLNSAPGRAADVFGKTTSDPELVKGPSKFRPFMVFIVVLLLFVGAAFVVENTGGRKGIRSFVARQRELGPESAGDARAEVSDPQPEFPVQELAAAAGRNFAADATMTATDPVQSSKAPVVEPSAGALPGRADPSNRQRQAARRPRNSRGQFTRPRHPEEARRTDQEWQANGGSPREASAEAPEPVPAETPAAQSPTGAFDEPEPVANLAVAAGGWRQAAERRSLQPRDSQTSAEGSRPADQQSQLP